MLNYPKAIESLLKLQPVTNNLAEQIKVIRESMTGRGVNPKDAPIVMDHLSEIENKLRMLGSNPDNPIPFDR